MFNPITAVKDLKRFRQIINVLIKHGFGQIVEQIGIRDDYIGKLIRKSKKTPIPSTPTSIAKRILYVLQDLGPTFIKFGQILSSRSDLLPEEIITELQKLQDKVPSFSYEDVKKQIESEFNKKLEDIFDDFSQTPMASASIGQVHKAVLKTGEKVIVKVQRPNIKEIIESDLDLLYILARLIEKNIPESNVLSPVGIIKEFDKAIHRELDFTIEARNAARFAKAFEDDENIIIPYVYKEFTGKKVLTEEFIEGVRLTDGHKVYGCDNEILAKRALHAILKMSFDDGFFHADPHPGNIFALKDNKIAIIDLGLIGKLTKDMKDKMVDEVIALLRRDVDGVARALYSMGIREKKINWTAFKTDVADIMDKMVGLPLNEINFSEIMKDLMEGARRHHIKIPNDYTMMGKALLTIEGVGRELYPELDIEGEARPFIENLIKKRWSFKRISNDIIRDLNIGVHLAKEIPQQINTVLEEIENERLTIQVKNPDFERQMATWEKISNRVTFGLIIASLFISSSIFIISSQEIPLMGSSIRLVLGLGGYITAVVLGLWVLISMLQSGKFK